METLKNAFVVIPFFSSSELIQVQDIYQFVEQQLFQLQGSRKRICAYWNNYLNVVDIGRISLSLDNFTTHGNVP